MWAEIGDAIASNFFEIFLVIALLVVLYVVLNAANRWHEAKNSVRLTELTIQREKLAMLKRQALLKDLADASIVLKDEEKERLDAIREDLSVLSRKNIALMNEIEAKMDRLERGTDHAKMQTKLQEIYEYEKKLFKSKEND